MTGLPKLTAFLLIYIIITLLFSGCSQSNPVTKLLNHLDKIVSILENNAKDIDKAADLTKKYLKDNIDEIGALDNKLNVPDEIKNIKKELDNKDFIFLLASIIERIKILEENYSELMRDQRVTQALTPFTKIFGL